MKHALIVALALLASACQDRFRYPCQDPANWDSDACKKPLCAVTQTCPDQLAKPEEMKGEVR